MRGPRWLNGLKYEPLVHFVGLGFCLFTLQTFFVEPEPPAQQIVVTADMVQRLVDRHAASTGQPPDAQTRRALVEQLVRSEVLQREARALGLDQGDLIVQRRLAQKMEFLLEQGAEAETLSPEELRAFRDAHAQDYTLPERIAFEERFFESEDARRETPTAMGPNVDLDMGALLRRYGESFVDSLAQAPLGMWVGPVTSKRGVHWVRVEARTARELPSVDAIESRLRDDARRATVAAHRERALAQLMTRYTVIVEESEP